MIIIKNNENAQDEPGNKLPCCVATVSSVRKPGVIKKLKD